MRLSNVSKHFGDVTAVDNVVLDIGDREFMVLLGPSGCGKSTLLRMVAGLEDPTEGEIWIGDQLVNDVPPKQRDIAMVFQSYALYPHKTVQANIEFPLKARGVGTRERSHVAREAAQVLGLSELLGRKPGALSGGQRQRVALARAIVRNPAVFLMDEPLSNLDAKLRGETRADPIALHQRVEGTFVYVTHDQVEAMTMGTRVAVMQRGVMEQVGPPQEVYDKPASLFVAQFLGTPPMNVFPVGTLERSDVLVGVRPEHITLDREGPLTARVLLVEALGYERLITCVLPNEARVVARTNDVDGPRRARRSSSTPSPVTATTSIPSPASARRPEVSRTKTREALLAFVFLLPALVILGVFVFYPLGRTIWLGLYRGGGFSGKKTYVGWHQYWDVFQSNEFRHSLGVTFVFVLITVPIGIGLGLGLAVLADKHLRGTAVLPDRLLLDGGHLGRRRLADLARAPPAPDRRAHQHPALQRPQGAGPVAGPDVGAPRPRRGVHLGQRRVHVHHHDGRPAEHPPRPLRRACSSTVPAGSVASPT